MYATYLNLRNIVNIDNYNLTAAKSWWLKLHNGYEVKGNRWYETFDTMFNLVDLRSKSNIYKKDMNESCGKWFVYLANFLQSTEYIGHDICPNDLFTTKNM